MRKKTPQISSLKRTLTMLEEVVADGGQSNVSTLARSADIPVATAHRQVTTLVEEGYLTPVGRGRHVAGARLLRLLQRLDEKQLIVNVAAPVLHRLAVRVRTIVQLGTLENEMVTYRLKIGQGAAELFTQVGMQLEAYCSGMGKVLLANLPREERDAYLANGPFVPLTPRTIIDADALARELDLVAGQGYAIDDGEIVEDLTCAAVPIRRPDGGVPAAISVSQSVTGRRISQEDLLDLLRATAREIEQVAFNRA
ncbi:transcriptional regulator, IclR family [Sphingobium chlorophenolicum L-1]|uniref:Transcriptional regulator, IclR family n=1 Tax=Sphingobium chlorophenolicum L-1 TaxID=690566 RepID=F6F3S4_SPHCR|nr:IclR family transcriptional regulator [Sphingobium chlorophenolicum]AEG51086.1 transcriptional regulator, IclR family [Sphingobium chlorophenolicum L-1]